MKLMSLPANVLIALMSVCVVVSGAVQRPGDVRSPVCGRTPAWNSGNEESPYSLC